LINKIAENATTIDQWLVHMSHSQFTCVQVSLLDPENEMPLKRVGELANINRQLSLENEVLERLLDGGHKIV